MAEDAAAAPREAGRRAVANTVLRAAAELLGKLASLVLFAAMARVLGQGGLGTFVFAFAAVQIALVPIDLGFDRWLLREVARERDRAHELMPNVLALKLAISLPVFGAGAAALSLLGYGPTVRHTAYVLALGLLLEALARTVFGIFMAIERSGLLAAVVLVQRFAGAGLGLAALAATESVVVVAAAYTAAAALGLVLALLLVRRTLGRLSVRVRGRRWPAIVRSSTAFGVQDVFTLLLFKLDAVLLAALATTAAVGRYGAAYRVFESTLFIVYAFAGAFAAMYAYLDTEGELPVRVVFARSIKAVMVVLAPIGVLLALLAEPICRLFFGADFAAAAEPLRLLAPAVVLLGIVTLSTSLVMSRERARGFVLASIAMVIVNVALNVVLIGPHQDAGAAAAMLITELLFTGVALVLAARAVGRLRLVPTVAGPLVAAAAMIAAMLPLLDSAVLSALAGCAAYVAVLVLVEWRVSPGDLRFVGDLLAGRLRRTTA